MPTIVRRSTRLGAAVLAAVLVVTVCLTVRPVRTGVAVAATVHTVPAPAGPAQATTAGTAGTTASATGWAAPVPGPLTVLTPFDPPATRYGPGHLGVDLAARQGEDVRAAAAGIVVFAGPVAGRGVVVVAHPGGISTEYEPLQIAVHRGASVVTGTVLGTVRGRHAACAPASCLHWGARRAGSYLNPLDLLSPLGPVRLLPWPHR